LKMKLYLLIILIRKNSERLLKNFKTIKNIINAFPQELSSKAKIPYKTSIKIWRILNEEYKG